MTHRPDLNTDCELVWAQLQVKGSKSIFIGSFYCSPDDKNGLEQLELSLSKLSEVAKSANIWIGGDFNLSDVDWSTNSVPKYATKGTLCQNLLNVTAEYSLSQMVTETTHHTDDSDTLIDLFLTNTPSTVNNIIHMPGLGVCKHDMIMVQIDVQPQRTKTPPRKILMYKKMDIDGLIEEAEDFCSDFINSNPEANTVDGNWTVFKNKMHQLIEKFIPSKVIRPSRDLPWMTKELKHKIRQKNRWYKKSKERKSHKVWSKYKWLQKEVKKEMQTAYWNYITNVLSPKMEDNPKIFWRFIKGLRRDNSGIAALRHQGKLESDGMKKSEILNNYFSSVFTKEDLTHIPDKGNTLAYPTMDTFIVTTPGVEKLLFELNPSKAAGPDGLTRLPSRVLRLLAQIAPVLTFIFNQSIQTGSLPSDWKTANVTPIFKKRDRAESKNYRPVSLTCICCKVLEHVIHSQIMEHLDQHDILSDYQHGFRKRRSCDSQLVITLHDLTQALDQKKSVDVIILDFTKAFDTVPHHRLLNKLRFYGINNQLIKWTSSFLMGRTQRVILEGQTSPTVAVDSGVPQGTVLGPSYSSCISTTYPTNCHQHQGYLRMIACYTGASLHHLIPELFKMTSTS